jgi:hypothetical protein
VTCTITIVVLLELWFTTIRYASNEGKSAASFCHQVAAWFTDMFCNFYSVKNHKIAKNSTTTKAKAKISTDLVSLEFYKKLPHISNVSQAIYKMKAPNTFTILIHSLASSMNYASTSEVYNCYNVYSTGHCDYDRKLRLLHIYSTGHCSQRHLGSNHRYLWEVDCSRHISLQNFHYNITRTHIPSENKAGRQTRQLGWVWQVGWPGKLSGQ